MDGEAASFSDLIRDVRDRGLCRRCGECVSVCSFMDGGALALDGNGFPVYRERGNCTQCGMCYWICPAVPGLEHELRSHRAWEPPMGRRLGLYSARSLNPEVLRRGTHGGVVTTLLMYLKDHGDIDGAIVARQEGTFRKRSLMAATCTEILEAAGCTCLQCMEIEVPGEEHSTFVSALQTTRFLLKEGLSRVALVGTPCQIAGVRKLEMLGAIPPNWVRHYFGLFCMESFVFPEELRLHLESTAGVRFSEIRRVHVQETLSLELVSGKRVEIPQGSLASFSRYACRFCSDFSAEYADISFGGIGSSAGWTTVVTRTEAADRLLRGLLGERLENYPPPKEEAPFFSELLAGMIQEYSDMKRMRAMNRTPRIRGPFPSKRRLPCPPSSSPGTG